MCAWNLKYLPGCRRKGLSDSLFRLLANRISKVANLPQLLPSLTFYWYLYGVVVIAWIWFTRNVAQTATHKHAEGVIRPSPDICNLTTDSRRASLHS